MALKRGVSDLPVEGLITGRLIHISPKENIIRAAIQMRDNNISCLLVKEKGSFTGVVSEKDIINKVVAEELYPGDIKVEEIMSHPIIRISRSESVGRASEIMKENRIRRLAVTEGGNIIGIITETDITRYLNR